MATRALDVALQHTLSTVDERLMDLVILGVNIETLGEAEPGNVHYMEGVIDEPNRNSEMKACFHMVYTIKCLSVHHHAMYRMHTVV